MDVFINITDGQVLNPEDLNARITGRGGGGKRRGMGPRNDVLTTCKAVNLPGGQRIIAEFFPQKIFLDFLEARSEP